MKSLTRIVAGFSAFWMAHAIHWYLVSEFSKFKRFDVIGSTMYATAFTAIGLLIGLVFKWRPAREVWQCAGKWSLLLSAAGVLLLVYDYAAWRLWLEDSQASWSRWPNLGYFLIGFPLLYLPIKKEAQPDIITAQRASRVAD